jgi:hypothetical protein
MVLNNDSFLNSEYFFIQNSRDSKFILCEDKSDSLELQNPSNNLFHSMPSILV